MDKRLPPQITPQPRMLGSILCTSLRGKLRNLVLFPKETVVVSHPTNSPANDLCARRAGWEGCCCWLLNHLFRKWHLNDIILGALALNSGQLSSKQVPFTATLVKWQQGHLEPVGSRKETTLYQAGKGLPCHQRDNIKWKSKKRG